MVGRWRRDLERNEGPSGNGGMEVMARAKCVVVFFSVAELRRCGVPKGRWEFEAGGG